MTPKEVINKEYSGGVNFMTPKILKTAWLIKNRAVYEISEGTGFNHDPLFGVTIVTVDNESNTKRKSDLSNCFRTIKLANYHVKLCREIIKAELNTKPEDQEHV